MIWSHQHRLYFLVPLALVCAVLLFVGGPDFNSLRSYRYGWGSGHLFCFALWAYLYALWRYDVSFRRLLVEALLLTIVVGGTTELLQSGIGREASWKDLGNDVVGSLVGIFFLAPARLQLFPLARKILQIPILVLAVWSLLPTAKAIVDDLIAHKQFPLLSGFETSMEMTRWNGSAKRRMVSEVVFSGQYSMRLDFSTQRYSGLGLKDFPHDWSSYGAVRLQVFNPDPESMLLHFRIHDRQHDNSYSDRYNSSFELKSGWNEIKVSLNRVAQAPKTRRLDLSQVAGMGVFVGKLDRPRTIYLDDIQLLP